MLMGDKHRTQRHAPKSRRNLILIIKILLLVSGFEFLVFFLCVHLLSKFESLNYFKALYLAVITIFTVGYGDIYPRTQSGQELVMFMLITGVGYISFFGSMVTTILIEGQLIQILGDSFMNRKIEQLRNHVIVCGLGRAGSSATR